MDIAGYRGRGDFCDPFCGSGTIAIEAALAAKGRAPGISRDFAAMQWAWLPAEVWPQAREEARAREFHGEYHIFASDIDPRAVAMARDNARRAGVDDCIAFAVADAREFAQTTDRGVIVREARFEGVQTGGKYSVSFRFSKDLPGFIECFAVRRRRRKG